MKTKNSILHSCVCVVSYFHSLGSFFRVNLFRTLCSGKDMLFVNCRFAEECVPFDMFICVKAY